MNELLLRISNSRENVSYPSSTRNESTNNSFRQLLHQFANREETTEITSTPNNLVKFPLNEIDVSGYSINISMIEMEEVSQLISLLPDELASETLVLFEENVQLEELFQDLDKLSHIVAIVVAGIYGEQAQERSPLNDVNVSSLIERFVTNNSTEVHDKQTPDVTTWGFIGSQLAENVMKIIENNSKVSDLVNGIKTEKNEQGPMFLFQKIATPLNSNTLVLNEKIDMSVVQNDKNVTSSWLGNSTLNQGTQPSLVVQNGEQLVSKDTDQQIQRQIQNILSRSQFTNIGNGVQQLLVKLHPESLGRLEITIQQLNGILVAKVMTSTAATRDILEGQLQQLRSAFQANHLQVERIEVTHQQGQSLVNKDPKEEQKHQQTHHNDETEKEDSEGDRESFSVFLEQTINVEV